MTVLVQCSVLKVVVVGLWEKLNKFCISDIETVKVAGYQVLDTGWNVEELKGKLDELVGDRAIVIF